MMYVQAKDPERQGWDYGKVIHFYECESIVHKVESIAALVANNVNFHPNIICYVTIALEDGRIIEEERRNIKVVPDNNGKALAEMKKTLLRMNTEAMQSLSACEQTGSRSYWRGVANATEELMQLLSNGKEEENEG